LIYLYLLLASIEFHESFLQAQLITSLLICLQHRCCCVSANNKKLISSAISDSRERGIKFIGLASFGHYAFNAHHHPPATALLSHDDFGASRVDDDVRWAVKPVEPQ
jgi:hypothetical protein